MTGREPLSGGREGESEGRREGGEEEKVVKHVVCNQPFWFLP